MKFSLFGNEISLSFRHVGLFLIAMIAINIFSFLIIQLPNEPNYELIKILTLFPHFITSLMFWIFELDGVYKVLFPFLTVWLFRRFGYKFEKEDVLSITFLVFLFALLNLIPILLTAFKSFNFAVFLFFEIFSWEKRVFFPLLNLLFTYMLFYLASRFNFKEALSLAPFALGILLLVWGAFFLMTEESYDLHERAELPVLAKFSIIFSILFFIKKEKEFKLLRVAGLLVVIIYFVGFILNEYALGDFLFYLFASIPLYLFTRPEWKILMDRPLVHWEGKPEVIVKLLRNWITGK